MYAWEKIQPIQQTLLQASSDNTMVYEECEEQKNNKKVRRKQKERWKWVKPWSEDYFFVFLRNKTMERTCCLRAAVVNQQLQPRDLLNPRLQDEYWKKPVASGALQVGYLPPG